MSLARPPRMPNGLPRFNVGLRMDADEIHDLGIAAFRLGVGRSTALRLAASIMADVVDDAWYLAQIGAEPSPSVDTLVDQITVAMAAEITAGSALLLQSDNGDARVSVTS